MWQDRPVLEEKVAWRRRSPATPVTPAQLAEILAAAGLHDSVRNVEYLSGGLVNTDYRLDLADGETLVLRLYDRDGSACAMETALLRMVKGDVPVPAVVHVEPAGFGALPPLALMTYIDGISLRTLKATLSDEELGPPAHAIGQVLARIAAVRFRNPGSLGPALDVGPWFAEPPDIVPKLIEGLHPRLESGLARRIDDFIAGMAGRLARFDTEARLVHGDYGSANVLMRRVAGRWEVAAVLDWEFAFSVPRSGTSATCCDTSGSRGRVSSRMFRAATEKREASCRTIGGSSRSRRTSSVFARC
jgi:Ser/Thr protein kinase RdoA (MazF antagonist)